MNMNGVVLASFTGGQIKLQGEHFLFQGSQQALANQVS